VTTTASQTFRLVGRYAQGDSSQVMGSGLSAWQIDMGVQACLSDMRHLNGEGLVSFTVELELPAEES
jgi:hypothetical protein